MEKNGILVTGGAGYIGSHIVRHLVEAGEKVIILDNLSTGFRDSVLGGELIVGDVGDQVLVEHLIRERDIDTVIHLAAHTAVSESVREPLRYYKNNTCASRSLLDVCATTSIRHFIFSSSAAVYGIPQEAQVNENTPTAPINPYGTSKLMTEWMLRDLVAVTKIRHVTMRYFNVAGSDPQGRIGQSTVNATLLIKVACEAAIGARKEIVIFGTDYPTPDGTGVRDYIHVEDIATAHLMALDYLRRGNSSTTLNCGYEHGYSVREVLDMVQHVSGTTLCIRTAVRRDGDPPILVANANKIKRTLNWKPQYDDLEDIVRTSLEWEQKLHINK